MFTFQSDGYNYWTTGAKHATFYVGADHEHILHEKLFYILPVTQMAMSQNFEVVDLPDKFNGFGTYADGMCSENHR